MLCSWPGRAAGLAAAPTMSLWLTGCVCSQGEDHLILTNPGNMPRKNTVHKTLVSAVCGVSAHIWGVASITMTLTCPCSITCSLPVGIMKVRGG